MVRVLSGRVFHRLPFLLAVMILSFSSSLYAMRPMTDAQKDPSSSTVFVQKPELLSETCLVLDNGWDYYKARLADPKDFYPQIKIPSECIVQLPHTFEQGVNYSSFHCRIEGLLPDTHYGMSIYAKILSSCQIFCNNRLAGGAGFLNTNAIMTIPAQNSSIIDLLSDSEGVLDILICAADFELDNGGIVRVPAITEKNTLEKNHMQQIFISLVIMSFLGMLIIYNFILIVYNRKPLVHFSLVVMFSVLILSVSATGLSMLNLVFTGIPFWAERRMSVAMLAFSVSSYIFYMGVSHRISINKAAGLYIFSIADILVTLFIPIRIFENYRNVFVTVPITLLVILVGFSMGFVIKRNKKTKEHIIADRFLYNFDMAVNIAIIAACIYDFIIAPLKINYLYPCLAYKFAAFSFGAMQCTIPAFRRYFTNYRIQKSSERFEQNNSTLSKFIPEQVLDFMSADSITKIIHGGCYTTEAMLVYTEIRYFKQLAEAFESEELFNVISEYYKEIAPVIRNFGGYIAKYMYHGCLAVFPERNDSCICCAVRMQEKMGGVKRLLRKKYNVDISIGIAIHTGSIACGIVGSERRFDTVTFSPEIQTVVDIGAQTSKMDAKIMISEDAMNYCRTYADCMYEGHFILSGGKRILVYSAIPYKYMDVGYDEDLEPAEHTEDGETDGEA